MLIGLFVFCCPAFSQTSGQTNIYKHPTVGEPVPDDWNSDYNWESPAGGADCNGLSPSNPCPYNNTPVRYMAINVHYLLSSDGKFNFSETGDGRGGSYNGYQRAEDIIREANEQLAENSPQYQNLHIPVWKINLQLVLAGVYFHRTNPSIQVGTNPVRYNWSTIWPTLNSYLVNNQGEVNCFFFESTPSTDGLANGNNITMQNDWDRYFKWETATNAYPKRIAARIILHEIFHNNGLTRHPFEGDQCDDTPVFPRCWGYDPLKPPCNDWANIGNNLMDYNPSSDWSLSPCQICRFNENIQTGRLLPQTPGCLALAPVRAFFDLPSKICAGGDVILQGSASFNESSYTIWVREVGAGGVVGSTVASRTFLGQVGLVNLRSALPFNFLSGKTYQVTLGVNSWIGGCEDHHSMSRTFTVDAGCSNSDFNADDEIKTLLVSPNPTNGLVNIQFDLDTTRNMSLQVYHLQTGTLVGTLKNAETTLAGLQTYTWDATPFSDGWYYVRGITQQDSKTATFLLQK